MAGEKETVLKTVLEEIPDGSVIISEQLDGLREFLRDLPAQPIKVGRGSGIGWNFAGFL